MVLYLVTHCIRSVLDYKCLCLFSPVLTIFFYFTGWLINSYRPELLTFCVLTHLTHSLHWIEIKANRSKALETSSCDIVVTIDTGIKQCLLSTPTSVAKFMPMLFELFLSVCLFCSLTYTAGFTLLSLIPSAWIHSERHAVRHTPRSTRWAWGFSALSTS